jgi:hypothetical protein
LTEITSKVNNVLPNTIFSRNVRRRLWFHGFTRRKIRKTLTILTENRHRRVHWCRSKRRCTLNRDWERVIFFFVNKINNLGTQSWKKILALAP